MIFFKWFFDYLDGLPNDSISKIVLIDMYVAWRKYVEKDEKELEQGE